MYFHTFILITCTWKIAEGENRYMLLLKLIFPGEGSLLPWKLTLSFPAAVLIKVTAHIHKHLTRSGTTIKTPRECK